MRYENSTKLSKYKCDCRGNNGEESEIKWSIFKRAHSCNEGSRNCRLCLEEKYYIISFPDSNKLLNKRSKLVLRCQHDRNEQPVHFYQHTIGNAPKVAFNCEYKSELLCVCVCIYIYIYIYIYISFIVGLCLLSVHYYFWEHTSMCVCK